MADVKIHNDVVVRRDVRDYGKHCLCRRGEGFRITVRDLRAFTGAGWLLALCGDLQTMPGLGARAAAFSIDIDSDGRTVGLF